MAFRLAVEAPVLYTGAVVWAAMQSFTHCQYLGFFPDESSK